MKQAKQACRLNPQRDSDFIMKQAKQTGRLYLQRDTDLVTKQAKPAPKLKSVRAKNALSHLR